MIQRIQSIWLLLASFAGFASIKWPFYSGNKITDAATQTKTFVHLNAAQNIWMLIATVAVAVAAFVAIFLYKDRKRQLMIVTALCFASAVNILTYFLKAQTFLEGNLALTAVFVLIIPVLLLLALRGIWKDEQLVRSTNRLR
ncbi:MAG: DUF4293 family protein [Chitinophagaceae bacterium]